MYTGQIFDKLNSIHKNKKIINNDLHFAVLVKKLQLQNNIKPKDLLPILELLGWTRKDIDIQKIKKSQDIIQTGFNLLDTPEITYDLLKLIQSGKTLCSVAFVNTKDSLDPIVKDILNSSANRNINLTIIIHGSRFYIHIRNNAGIESMYSFDIRTIKTTVAKELIHKFLDKDTLQNIENIHQNIIQVINKGVEEDKQENHTIPSRTEYQHIFGRIQEVTRYITRLYNKMLIKQPNKFTFLGQTYPVKSWTDLYIKLLELMYRKENFLFFHIFKLNRRAKTYFSNEKDSIVKPQIIPGTYIYAETDLKPHEILQLIFSGILPLFGYSNSDIEIYISDEKVYPLRLVEIQQEDRGKKASHETIKDTEDIFSTQARYQRKTAETQDVMPPEMETLDTEVQKAFDEIEKALNILDLSIDKNEPIAHGKKTIPTITTDIKEYIGTKPTGFVFLGQSVETNHWSSLYISIIKLLIDKYPETSDKLIQIRGKKRAYFSYQKEELRSPKIIPGTNIYAETNLSTTDMLRILIYKIFPIFGYSAADLSIFIEDSDSTQKQKRTDKYQEIFKQEIPHREERQMSPVKQRYESIDTIVARFLDRKIKSTSWDDLYIKILSILAKSNEHTFTQALEQMGTDRYLFSKDKSQLTKPRLVEGTYLYAELAIPRREKFLLLYNEILPSFGYSPDDLQILYPVELTRYIGKTPIQVTFLERTISVDSWHGILAHILGILRDKHSEDTILDILKTKLLKEYVITKKSSESPYPAIGTNMAVNPDVKELDIIETIELLLTHLAYTTKSLKIYTKEGIKKQEPLIDTTTLQSVEPTKQSTSKETTEEKPAYKTIHFQLMGKDYITISIQSMLAFVLSKIADAHEDSFYKVLQLNTPIKTYFSPIAKGMKKPYYIPKGHLYVDLNLSYRKSIDLIEKVLKLFGYPPDTVKIIYKPEENKKTDTNTET